MTLDVLEMTLEYIHVQHVPISITFSPQNCVKIKKKLLLYDFEKAIIEYICKNIGKKRFVKVEIKICILSSTGKNVRPTKMTTT